jgi:hypothetical protein
MDDLIRVPDGLCIVTRVLVDDPSDSSEACLSKSIPSLLSVGIEEATTVDNASETRLPVTAHRRSHLHIGIKSSLGSTEAHTLKSESDQSIDLL